MEPADLTASSRNWMKLSLLQKGPLKDALLCVFHNDSGTAKFTLDREPSSLYAQLLPYKPVIKNCKFIHKPQHSVIFPANQKTDSSKFDITLLAVIIRVIGLYDSADEIMNHVEQACKWRNKHQHKDPHIEENEFEQEWAKGETIIKNLKYNYDTHALKLLPLDFNNDQAKKLLREYKELKNGKVLEDALEVVCKNIGNDWVKLSERLELKKIEDDDSIYEEKMRKSFLPVRNSIIWPQLKDALSLIEREDIVDKISKDTLVTIGRKNASNGLQKIYRDELKTLNIDRVFEDSTIQEERAEAYVDLAILEATEIDKIYDRFSNTDRKCFLQQLHYQRKNISMEEILDEKHNFVIVRGIAGIGKSTMINTYTLKWARQEILKDEICVRFLFKFTCRELNALLYKDPESFGSVESLLQKNYREIMKFITMNDLREMSSSVLILIDGLDELKDISSFNKHEKPQHLQCITDLINPLCKELRNNKTIVVGRPEACQTVRAFCRKKDGRISLQTVEIFGFNEDSIKAFIGKKFKDDQRHIDQVTEKVLNTENLRYMARIPVYLWVLCQIFDENIDMENIQNTTQLCTYALLLFIKGHLRLTNQNSNEEIEQKNLYQLCKDRNICEEVLLLAQLSMATFQERKVVFTEEDMKNYINVTTINTEGVGFIVKNGDSFQFRHLVLQEYLTGLYIALTGDYSKLKTTENLSSCLHVVAGLCGFEKRESEENEVDRIVPPFIKNLREHYNNKTSILSRLFKPKSNFQDILEDELKKMLQLKRDKELVVDETCSNIMTAVHEYSCQLTEDLRKRFKTKTVIVRNLIFQHDIKHASSFLRYLEIGSVGDIDITNFGNNKLPSNIDTLFQLYFQDKERNKRCCELRMDDEMSITSRGYQRIEKCVVVNFARESKNQQQHHELIMSLIGMVCTISIDYSLDFLYTNLKELLNQYREENNGEAPTLKLPKPLVCFTRLSNPTPSQVEIYSDLIVSECRSRNQIVSTVSLNQEVNGDHIQKLASCAPYIEELDLSGDSKITAGALAAFREITQMNAQPAFSKLRLDGRTLTPDHFQEIAAIIRATSIEVLSLDRCIGLTPDSMHILCDAVLERYSQSGKILKSISLRKCKLTNEQFSNILPAFKCIKCVDMAQNGSLSERVLDLLMGHVSEIDICLLEVLNLSQTSITKYNHDAFKEVFAIRFDQQIHIIT